MRDLLIQGEYAVETLLKLAADLPPGMPRMEVPYPDVTPDHPGPRYLTRLLGDAALIAGGATLGAGGAEILLNRLERSGTWQGLSPAARVGLAGLGAAAGSGGSYVLMNLLKKQRNKRVNEAIERDEAARLKKTEVPRQARVAPSVPEVPSVGGIQ